MAKIQDVYLPAEALIEQTSKQSRREAEEMSAFLRTLPEKRWSRFSFCTEWTIKDVAEHQAVQGGQMRDAVKSVLYGTPLPDRTPEGRQRAKESLWDLNRLELSDRLSEVTHEFYDLLEKANPEQLQKAVPSAAGVISLLNLSSFRLSELSLHSWDVRVVENMSVRVSRQSLPLLYPGLLAAVEMLADASTLKDFKPTTYQFELEGAVEGPVVLQVGAGEISAKAGYAEQRDLSIRLDSDAFLRLLWGRFKALEQRIQDGWIKVDGDLQTALKLNKLFAGFE